MTFGKRQRGMTLIELMFAMALSLIVIAGIAQTLFFQQRAYQVQLDLGQAQQNARASMALIKHYLRLGGWGLNASHEMIGNVGVGACYDTAETAKESFDCDNVDYYAATDLSGVDRLRIMFMKPDNGGVIKGHLAVTNKIYAGDNSGADPSPADHPFVVGSLALISGRCTTTGEPAIDLVKIDSAAASGSAYFEYGFTVPDRDDDSLSCVDGYQSGYIFGAATVADLYVDKMGFFDDPPEPPVLRLRLNPEDDLRDGLPVAYNVDDFQVHYYIDTTDPPDETWDVECDDINNAGTCNTGLTVRENLARLVAVQVALVVRTDTFRSEWKKSNTENMTVHNHTFAGKLDGYKRWVYRTTVRLRNNALR